MHDPEGRLLWVNAAMADALGYDCENMTGRALSDFVADEAHERPDNYLDRTRSLSSGIPACCTSYRATANGACGNTSSSATPTPNRRPTCWVPAQDVTLRHR